jgi:hypothetical protein
MARVSYLGLLSKKRRIEWLKSRLHRDIPVIVIVGNDKYLHYISLLGYDSTSFFIYDSLIKSDMNGSKSGNINVGYYELIDKMNSARWKSIKLNIAISN